jgi:type VI secretion system protein ImpJ
MKQLSRVVWSEGMHLAPHHFQAQSRYFEDTVHFATSALWYGGYGLIGHELDAEALRNGTVSLVHARGLFPDGLPFHMPEGDPLPAARNITELFSPVRERLTIYLGIPPRKPDTEICAQSGEAVGATTRYIAESYQLHDENTGRDEKPIHLGRKNIQILLEDELNENLVALPLARVMRDGSGHFVYDPIFIPPCVRISASEPLMLQLRRLVEILEEKSNTLSLAAPGGGDVATSFSRQEVAGFWFLHSVNTALATLRNLCFSKKGHPEEVYVELSRLAGALCTFALDAHPGEIPLYDHDRLDECFGALVERIRLLLDTVIPTNCVTIPLKPSKTYFYAGETADQRVLGRSQWIFSVRSDIGEADLIRLTPQLVKICSEEFVGKLVERALPGMTLTHLSVPPSAVAPKVEYQYFGVSRSGPCWDHIVKTRKIGVYVPGEIPAPEIGLHVILESR